MRPKKVATSIPAGIAISLACAYLASSYPSVFPTGTTIYKPQDAWEYVNRGGTTRPSPVAYDYCPQLRALPKPAEYAVTPPNNLEWHITPDELRNKLQ
jgi:hypothetical protein